MKSQKRHKKWYKNIKLVYKIVLNKKKYCRTAFTYGNLMGINIVNVECKYFFHRLSDNFYICKVDNDKKSLTFFDYTRTL